MINRRADADERGIDNYPCPRFAESRVPCRGLLLAAAISLAPLPLEETPHPRLGGGPRPRGKPGARAGTWGGGDARRDDRHKRDRSMRNVAGMTRREQLDVAGCSCRRLRHRRVALQP